MEAKEKLTLLDQLKQASIPSPPSAQAVSKITSPSKSSQKSDDKEQLSVPVSEVSETGPEQTQPPSKSPRNKQGLTFTETMEKLDQQRMQELKDCEAKELVRFFKVNVLN